MSTAGAEEQITKVVLSWEGVSAYPHRFGGTEYRLGRREVGHIHGDHMVDVPFPKKVRDEVVVAGHAEPHHLLPETGWVSLYIKESADIERAIALVRRSFELAMDQQTKRSRKPEVG